MPLLLPPPRHHPAAPASGPTRRLPAQGDGNCQFRAIADQLWGSQAQHGLVRRLACAQLEAHPDAYKGFVTSGPSYSDYLRRLRRNGEWGDHVTLQAVADKLGVEIALVTSFEETARGGDAVVLVTPRAMAEGKLPIGEEGRTLWLCARAAPPRCMGFAFRGIARLG